MKSNLFRSQPQLKKSYTINGTHTTHNLSSHTGANCSRRPSNPRCNPSFNLYRKLSLRSPNPSHPHPRLALTRARIATERATRFHLKGQHPSQPARPHPCAPARRAAQQPPPRHPKYVRARGCDAALASRQRPSRTTGCSLR